MYAASQSISSMRPSSVTIMFSGFRSPWARSECSSPAAARSKARAVASMSLAVTLRLSSASRVSPATYSCSRQSTHMRRPPIAKTQSSRGWNDAPYIAGRLPFVRV